MLAVTCELDWDTVMRLGISLPMAQLVRGRTAFYGGTWIPSRLTHRSNLNTKAGWHSPGFDHTNLAGTGLMLVNCRFTFTSDCFQRDWETENRHLNLQRQDPYTICNEHQLFPRLSRYMWFYPIRPGMDLYIMVRTRSHSEGNPILVSRWKSDVELVSICQTIHPRSLQNDCWALSVTRLLHSILTMGT